MCTYRWGGHVRLSPDADVGDAGFFAAHVARRVDRGVARTPEFDVVWENESDRLSTKMRFSFDLSKG